MKLVSRTHINFQTMCNTEAVSFEFEIGWCDKTMFFTFPLFLFFTVQSNTTTITYKGWGRSLVHNLSVLRRLREVQNQLYSQYFVHKKIQENYLQLHEKPQEIGRQFWTIIIYKDRSSNTYEKSLVPTPFWLEFSIICQS